MTFLDSLMSLNLIVSQLQGFCVIFTEHCTSLIRVSAMKEALKSCIWVTQPVHAVTRSRQVYCGVSLGK
jgi:hypothetical protein